MFVNGLGTANPPHRYSKAACWVAFRASDWFRKLDRRSHVIAETVLIHDNGIESRSLSVSSLDAVFPIDPGSLHARFLAHAPALATAAFAQVFTRPVSTRIAASLLARFPKLLSEGARWTGKAETFRGKRWFDGAASRTPARNPLGRPPMKFNPLEEDE